MWVVVGYLSAFHRKDRSGDDIAKILAGEEIKRDENTGASLELSSSSAVPETYVSPPTAATVEPTSVPVAAD